MKCPVGLKQIKLSTPDEREGKTEESSSVLKYYKAFDFEAFYQLDEMSQKKHLLDTLYNALLELCKKFDWPKVPFTDVYNKVLEEGFINHYVFRQKKSRNRKYVARIVCHHESDRFDCFVSITDKDEKEVFNKLIFTEEPDEFQFNGLLGDIKWADTHTLTVLNSDKSVKDSIDLTEIVAQ
ncbi:hypothetical protein EYS14_23785 [Alteromonadaceae bacterium M269]|nr:hypothetical protein EYS14_23785 [Alteromonadaceae bacterium M269]